MKCEECREMLVEVVEAVATAEECAAVAEHTAACGACREELAAVQALQGRLVRAGHAAMGRGERMGQRGGNADGVMERIGDETGVKNWRLIMWRSMKWGSGVAAAVVMVVMLAVWGQGSSAARAADVLKDGAKAMGEATTLHITGRMRTPPQDNFEMIGPAFEFVPVEMWKRTVADGLQWRVEKSRRIMVMDGKATWMWIKPSMAIKMGKNGGDVGLFRPLLDVADVLEHERTLANEQDSTLTLKDEKVDGRAVSVVTVEAKAQGNLKNDWVKNKSITESDNRRVYRFDADTKRLEGMEVWVHVAPGNDVLVFQTTSIEYPKEIADAVFKIDLPQGMEWQSLTTTALAARPTPAAVDGDKTPEEVTRAFLEAFGKGDEKAVQEFFMVKTPRPVLEMIRTGKVKMKIVSVGKSFKSGMYPGRFVPYEIEFSNEQEKETKKGNLAIRDDNPTGRWFVDGGF